MPTGASIAFATAVIGTGIAAGGAIQTNQAQSRAASASRQQEELRRQQLELENIRKQRAIIRQAQAARAQAIASASSRGVLQSDVLPGSLGQIESTSGAALIGQSENTAISRGIFDTNITIANARADAATGQAVSDFGKTLFNNSQAIGRLGSTFLDSGIGDWTTTISIGGNNGDRP